MTHRMNSMYTELCITIVFTRRKTKFAYTKYPSKLEVPTKM